MLPTIKVRYEDGLFVPLGPVQGIEEGEILEFAIPDPDVVYLCETDRLAALDNGKVVRVDTGKNPGNNGAHSANA